MHSSDFSGKYKQSDSANLCFQLELQPTEKEHNVRPAQRFKKLPYIIISIEV